MESQQKHAGGALHGAHGACSPVVCVTWKARQSFSCLGSAAAILSLSKPHVAGCYCYAMRLLLALTESVSRSMDVHCANACAERRPRW
jgi:hypothetical protein